MALISHKSAPTSNVFDFTGLSLSGYAKVRLHLAGLVVDTDGTEILLQFYIGGVLSTSGYRRYLRNEVSSGSAGNASASQADSSIKLAFASTTNWAVGSGGSESFSGVVDIGNATLALYKLVGFQTVMIGATGSVMHTFGGGSLDNTGTLNGIKISGGGGLITAGTATLEGVPTS